MDPTSPGKSPRRFGQPILRLSRALERFLHLQAAGGIVLIVATAIALVAANSPWAESWAALWEQRISIRIGDVGLDYPLWYWINDGLMVVFFFVIGLEVKRELVWGELRDRRNVVLPAMAAIGGVAVPVALYLALQPELPGRAGWAVPMATDIAFVVGGLALLGARVPVALKVFIVSLAIVDDILAVAVIAVFFSSSIDPLWIAGAVIGFAAVMGLHRAGVRRVGVYVLVGAAIWLCALKSGIHPTVAGVLLGLLTPASAWIGESSLVDVAERAIDRLRGGAGAPDQLRRSAAEELAFAATESVSPLERLEHALHPWVAFVIMPVFALANAGVAIELEALGSGIAIATMVGLVVGKPLGIVLASWLTIRAGWARLPEGVTWPALIGAGCLAGIGFTMALFIASLSLGGDALAEAKTGVLAASALAMAAGLALLAVSLRGRPPS